MATAVRGGASPSQDRGRFHSKVQLINRGVETPNSLKPADQIPSAAQPIQQQPASNGSPYDMSHVVRQTAQSLMQRWARGEDAAAAFGGGYADDAVTTPSLATPPPPFSPAVLRSPQTASGHYFAHSRQAGTTASTHHHSHRRLAQSDVIPPRWDAVLCDDDGQQQRAAAMDSGGATATIIMFQAGTSAPLSWDVVVRPELLTTGDAGESRRNSIAPEGASTASPSASISNIDTYGLSEQELRYFGLIPGEGENPRQSHRRTPKELLLAQLRAPASSSIAPPPPKDSRTRSAATGDRSHETRDSGVIIGLPRPKIVIHNIAAQRSNRSPTRSRSTSRSSFEEPQHHHDHQGGSEQRPLSPPIVLPPAAAVAVPQSGGPRSPTTSPNRSRGRSFLSSHEKPLNERFKRPGHCDATNVGSLMHMHALTKAIMSEKSGIAAGRRTSETITSIDCSGTRLARQAKFAIPTSFSHDGNPIWMPRRSAIRRKRQTTSEDGDDEFNNSSGHAAVLADVGYWPDEQVALRKQRIVGSTMSFDEVLHTQVVLNAVAERSLSLGYLAPLLFLRGGSRCRITSLTARRCDLNDSDAIGIATILRCPSLNAVNGTNYECHLTHIDLSDNAITDEGADALKKAIKYNSVIVELVLRENPIRNEKEVLNVIKRRLRNNRNGVSNLGFVARMIK
jgi:hypothetical protein